MSVWIIILRISRLQQEVEQEAGYFATREEAETWIAVEKAKVTTWDPDFVATELQPRRRSA